MFKKGYMLAVTSWENDADNYQTNNIHVDTLDEVKFWLEWLHSDTCKSINNGDGGLGNLCDHEYDRFDFDPHVEHMAMLLNKHNVSYHKCDIDYFNSKYSEAMGYSGYYLYRIFESVEVYYFEKDIHPLNQDELRN